MNESTKDTKTLLWDALPKKHWNEKAWNLSNRARLMRFLEALWKRKQRLKQYELNITLLYIIQCIFLIIIIMWIVYK